MADDVVIPFPESTTRERIVRVENPDDWQSPYTGEQALAIAIFNQGASGDLNACCHLAKSICGSLKPMGFTVEFTGVKRAGS